MKIIQNYKILNHGIDGSQYFPGCGVACTLYTHVYTGIGESAHEALEDALEQAATDDWNVEEIKNDLDETENIEHADNDEDEMHYFVSIQIK
jgi:hypothetical protein